MRLKLITTTILLFFFVGFLLCFYANDSLTTQLIINVPPNKLTPKNNTASIMLDFEGGTVKILKDNFIDGETLFNFLKTLAEKDKIEFKYKEYKDLGILIEKSVLNKIGKK